MKIYNIINIPKGLSQEIECDCREEYNSGYTAGLEEGFDTGYDSGYTDGAESVDCEDFYNSGYTDGYESGYTSGYTDGQESVDCTDFYNSGVTDGYASGYTSGRTDGYDDGWHPGYDSGRTDGEEAGYNIGHRDGYEEGREYQKTLLVSTAITTNGTYEREDGFNQVVVNVPSMSGAGYDSGYTDGYASGYTDGSEDGFDSGYTSGKTDGYGEGYTSGKTDGYGSGVTAGEEAQKAKLTNLSISENDLENFQNHLDGNFTREDGWNNIYVSIDINPNISSAWTRGYEDGYPSGVTDGYASGYTSGRTDGYQDGWQPGYNSGYTDGMNTCGGDYASGYTDGFETGYDSGYTDGQASVDCQDFYDSGYTSGKTDGIAEQKAKMTELDVDNGDLEMSPGGVLEKDFYNTDGWNHVWVAVDTIDWWNSGYTSGVTDGGNAQKAKLASTAITENGTYTRPDGWSAVTVNVPQTGYTQQDLDNAYNSGWTGGYDSGYTDGMEECQPTTATSISVSVPTLEPGETGNTNVSITPGGAFTRLVFTSSDDSVATIDNGGSITAVGTGTTNICVEDTVSQLVSCAVLTVRTPITASADVTATVQARSSSQLTQIATEDTLGSVSKMAIDGTEITPVSAYTFGDTNPHTLEVWYLSTTVPYGAFEGCVRFQNVAISDRMLVIGGRAFMDCTGITSVQIGTGVTNINNSAFQGCSSLTSIIVPNNVTSMGTNVFYNCTSLTSATFGTGLTVISSGTVRNCTALQSVTINGDVTEIAKEAFGGCNVLNNVVLPNNLVTIGETAFRDCTSFTNVQMPNSVVNVGSGVFQGCSAMTAVSISTGLSAITDNMFSGCSSLTGVVLPDTIQTIGGNAFMNCGHMVSAILSTGLTAIGDHAFENCTYLRGIDIPATVTRIGAFSFRFDASLPVNGITVRNSTPCEIGTQAFDSTDDAPIYVPAESVETYKNSTALNHYWATYASRIQAIQ